VPVDLRFALRAWWSGITGIDGHCIQDLIPVFEKIPILRLISRLVWFISRLVRGRSLLWRRQRREISLRS